MAVPCPCCGPPWAFRPPLGCTHRRFVDDLSVPPLDQWNYNHNPSGGGASTGITCIITDPSDDSVYVCGKFSATDAATMRKHDAGGVVQWSVANITSSTDLSIDLDSYGQSVIGTAQTTGPNDPYIFKRASDGTLVWSIAGNNTNLTGAFGVCVDSNDNVIAAQGGSVARIEKFDYAGVYQWEYGSGSALSVCRSVDTDSSDNIYYAGSNGSGVSAFGKLNSSGASQWAVAHMTTGSGDDCHVVSVSPDSTKILCGGNISDTDGKVLRCLDASGSILWSLALYSSGTFTDRVRNVCWDVTGAFCYAMQVSGRYSKISSAGVVQWTGFHGAQAWDVHVSASGVLHIGGNLTTTSS